MSTPLYTTDVQKITDRTAKTTLADTDVLVVANSSGTLAPITKVNAKKTLGIDDAETALTAVKGTGWTDENLVDHEDRITQNESDIGTLEVDVADLETEVDTNRLYSDSQYLDLKAKYDAQQIALNASKAELYTDAPILQYGAVEIIGDGYEANDTPIDVSANVVDGKLDIEQKGLTITNLVTNGDFSAGTSGVVPSAGTVSVSDGILSLTGSGASNAPYFYMPLTSVVIGHVTFFMVRFRVTNSSCTALRLGTNQTAFLSVSVLNPVQNQWYTILYRRTNENVDDGFVRCTMLYVDATTANGKVMEVDGNYGVSAYNLTTLGLDHITDTAILSKLLPYVDGTKSVGKMGIQILDADDNVTQTIFLPAIGNSLSNGVADSIKTVSDGWEHTKRVYTPEAVLSGVAVNTANYPTAKNAGQWVNELTAGGTEIGVVGTDSTTGAGMLRFELATPITTHYSLPLPTSGKTIHRFAGEEKIALYGTGLTFTENVLSVLSAVSFVAGVMTDITSLATITDDTVTFSGVNATDVVYVKVEHDVDRPLGILEHTPAVSNTASRLSALEAAVFGG